MLDAVTAEPTNWARRPDCDAIRSAIVRYGSPAERTQDAALALRGCYSSRLRAWRWVGPFVYPLRGPTASSSLRVAQRTALCCAQPQVMVSRISRSDGNGKVRSRGNRRFMLKADKRSVDYSRDAHCGKHLMMIGSCRHFMSHRQVRPI
jgi:hypothetical protein